MMQQKWFIDTLIKIGLMLILSISCVWPQVGPVNILQESLSSQSKESENVLPDIAKLSGSWFQYFETQKGEELDRRIDLFVERLELRTAELGEDKNLALASIISQIKANLKAYAHLKNREKLAVVAPTTEILKSYNISQLMGLYHLERDLSTQVKRLNMDISDQDKQSRDLTRQLDNLTVKLIETHDDVYVRYTDAVGIILLQTEVALIEQRLSIQRQNLEELEGRLRDTENQKDRAIKLLQFSEEERKALDEKVSNGIQRVQEATARLLREQSQVLMVPEETSKDKAVERLRSQRVLRAKVNLASAETRLLIYQTEQISLILLNGEEEEKGDEWNLEALQKKLDNRYKLIQDLTVKARDWFSQNEFERTQSNTYLAEVQNKGVTDEEGFLIELAKDRLSLVQETSVLLQKLQTEIADSLFLMKIVEDQLLSYQGMFLNWVSKTKSSLSLLWDSIKKNLKTALFKVGDTPITALSFAKFIIIVFSCWWVAYWLNKILYRIGNSRGDAKLPIYYLVGRLAYYGIFLFGFLYALTVVGIDFANFALVAGALAIGLGFGLQSIVNNFVSGLILLFERSIKVGDFIELQERNLWGEVKEINVRATVIRDNDSVDIVIPNSELISTKILNWTLSEPNRRMRYTFKVAYGEDKDLVREAVLSAAEALPHTLKGIPGRNPAVWLTKFDEFCYEFELVVWLTSRAVKRPNGVKAAYLWAIDSALREYGVEIPVPQREHRFRDGSFLPLQRYVPPDVEDQSEPIAQVEDHVENDEGNMLKKENDEMSKK